MIAKFIVRNIGEFKAELERADKTRMKAAQSACKIEGFRLKNVLAREIRAGAPGGRAFAPVSEIAAKLGKTRKVLRSLARIVRYRAGFDGGKYEVNIGFVDTPTGKISKSWYRIVFQHQAGFKSDPDRPKFIRGAMLSGGTSVRKWLRKRGGELGQRSKARKYFFLRKSTTELVSPARPIINPFWAAHRAEAETNIANSFNRKLSGDWVKVKGTEYV